MNPCEKCGKEDDSNFWKRCQECYYCDDCGERTRNILCTYVEGLLCNDCHDVRIAARIVAFDGCTHNTSEITCPHCGYIMGDSWEYSDGVVECCECENEFEMESYTDVTYNTKKIIPA